MRKFLYLSLMDKIFALKNEVGESVIKTVDLWNEQVEFIEQEDPFELPAIFIEFQPIRWMSLSGNVQQADATIRLHILTNYQGNYRSTNEYREESLQRMELLDQLDEHLNNTQDKNEKCGFCMFQRIGSSTNHNHEEIIEDITDFSTRLTQHL